MEYRWTEKKKTGIAAAVIVLLLILIGLFSLQIKTVTVTGNVRYTQEQITEMLFPDKVSRNPVVCYLKDHFQEHVEIPFVQDYKIEFQGLNKVEIIVYETSVVGYVSYMSSCMYFDKDGIVVESTSKTLPGIPEIMGLKFGHIVLYQKLPVENDAVFQEILNLTQILSIYQLEVNRIQYNSFGEAALYMGDLEVILGNNVGMNGKIAELSDMLPKLEGRKGTLYLDTYDETATNAMYAFKPRQ